MSAWMLAIIYFGLGILGAIIYGCLEKKSKSFGLILILGAVIFACRYFETKVSFSGILIMVWGGSILLLSGIVIMLIINAYFTSKNRHSARAAGKRGESQRLSKSVKRRMLGRAMLILPLTLALATGVVMIYTSLGTSSGSGVLDNTIATPDAIKSKTLNILICGIDNDKNDAAHLQNMTDVIILANVDLENKKAALLQIPRDTYVGDITATGKINAVYNKEKNEQNAINTLDGQINKMMKLPIDNYVTITMEGFRKAVDEIGGVEVNLEKEMVFNLRDTDEKIVRTITLPAGVNTLDGTMADLFVRYRDYVSADIDRMNVQRIFMAALMNKLSALSAPKLMSVTTAVYPYLNTDFSIAELTSLAMKAKDFSADAITALRVPGEPAVRANQSVFTVHKKELADLLNLYMRPHSESVPPDELEAIELQHTTDLLDHSDKPLSEYGA
ncbi:MAG: LCP family protein [Oscillospiraceae bacterium]